MSNLFKWGLPGGVAAALRGVWSESLLQKVAGVMGANAFSNFAAFSITVYAARALGPADFGRLTLAISIVTLLPILLDFGLDITLVRLYNITTSPEEGAGYIKVILGFKVFSLLVLIPLAFLLQRITTELLPALSGYDGLTYLAFVSSGLMSMWITVRAVEQARGDFRSFRRYTFAYGIFRFLSMGALILFYEVSPISVFGALYTVPLVGLLLYSWFSGYRRPFWLATAAHAYRSSVYGRLRTAFSYSAWVALSAICFNALSRLPQFALGHTASEEEVGLYGAGATFVMVFGLMNTALRTVILPNVTALRNSSDRLRFRQRFLRWGPAFLGLALSALGFMVLVQYYLLGAAYAASVPVFVVLSSASMVTLYLGIFNTLVHSHGIPRMEATNNLARVIALALLLLLVPKTALSVGLTYAAVVISGELIIYTILRYMDVGSHKGELE